LPTRWKNSSQVHGHCDGTVDAREKEKHFVYLKVFLPSIDSRLILKSWSRDKTTTAQELLVAAALDFLLTACIIFQINESLPGGALAGSVFHVGCDHSWHAWGGLPVRHYVHMVSVASTAQRKTCLLVHFYTFPTLLMFKRKPPGRASPFLTINRCVFPRK